MNEATPAWPSPPSPFAGSDWFDPLEAAVRGQVRAFIEQLLEEELEAALGRERYERGAISNGRRHGHRPRQQYVPCWSIVVFVWALISVSDKTGLEAFAGARRARRRADLDVRHGGVPAGARPLRDEGRGSDRRRRDARRPRQDAAPEACTARCWPAATCPADAAVAGRARDRADRPPGRQPVPVRPRLARAATSRRTTCIEAIDIGGPAMIRAAAKNHANVGVVVDPERYGFLLDELGEGGELSLGTRRELAAEAFAHTAGYDIAIANWFLRRRELPRPPAARVRQGHRPAVRREPAPASRLLPRAGARRHLLSRVTQHGGKPLSFNNLLDLDAAGGLVGEFSLPGCAIVKHGNPCGVALAAGVEEAYEQALAADAMSAFGGVDRRQPRRHLPLAEAISEQFATCARAGLRAGGARAAAAQAVAACPRDGRAAAGDAGRARLAARARRHPRPGPRHRVRGPPVMEVVTTAQPTEQQWGDLLFAWRVAKHVRSNAIVLASDLATRRDRRGQMSRVDAAGSRSARRGEPVRARRSRPTPSSRSPTACRPCSKRA